MDSTYLGLRIKQMRIKKNRTPLEIAEYLGINRATLSKYENGTITPTLETFINIVRFFECSPSELLKDYIEVTDDNAYHSVINSLSMMSRQEIEKLSKELDNYVTGKSSFLNGDWSPFIFLLYRQYSRDFVVFVRYNCSTGKKIAWYEKSEVDENEGTHKKSDHRGYSF